MIKNIITLVVNDFAIAFSNKSIFLILFIPLFVNISLKLTDRADLAAKKINIGLIQNEIYPSVILKDITIAEKSIAFSRVSVQEGKNKLKDRTLDGVLINSHEGLTLLVLRKESIQTAAIVESLSMLQKNALNAQKDWITEIKSIQQGNAQKQMLPVWILMMVLLVSFIIIPAQVAEEKEKNLLIGLLQTPMRETEWILSKVLTGCILISLSVILLHLPEGLASFKKPAYILFLAAGSFCFVSGGVLVGFMCRTQASARTVGILFYLPLLMPAALSDFSIKLNKFASFVPSYQLYSPLKSILLENSRFMNFFWQWMFIILIGTAAYISSYSLMKRRWLM